MKAVTTFYRRVVYGYRSTDLPVPELGEGLEITELDQASLSAYRSFRPDQSGGQAERRLESGHRCLLTWVEGRIVDAAWLTRGTTFVPYLRARLALEETDLYVFDSYTDPEHRGVGLYQAKNAYVYRLAAREGFRRVVAVIAAENRAPLLLNRRSGGLMVGMYHYLRLGPASRWWSEPWTGEPMPELLPGRDGG